MTHLFVIYILTDFGVKYFAYQDQACISNDYLSFEPISLWHKT